jgi:hypothetical protein
VTGHGFVNFPAKDSCIVYVSDVLQENEEQCKIYKYINLEHLARNCATQKNVITVIINNACLSLPKDTNLEKISKSEFAKETNGM